MAALRAAVFPLSAKNRRGGYFLPPPPPVRVLIDVHALCDENLGGRNAVYSRRGRYSSNHAYGSSTLTFERGRNA